MKLVQINVGGHTFITNQETLKSAAAGTRLADLSTSSAEYVPEHDFYFFDRNPELFGSVLDFLRTGELHLPKHVCGAAIRNELEFWRVEAGNISECCLSSLFHFENELEVTNNLKEQFESSGLEYTTEQLTSSRWNRIKNVVWNFLEKAKSSRAARAFSVFYLILVLVTCITFIIGSHPLLRYEHLPDIKLNDTHTISAYEFVMQTHNNKKVAMILATEEYLTLYIINIICMTFFTTELMLRFVVCPKKKQFFKIFQNAIDLVIVIAMWLAFFLDELFRFDGKVTVDERLLWLFLFARSCIILRLLRLFRLAKHYSGLKVLFLALKASIQELGLLLLTFMIATSLFAGIIFYAEFLEPTTFENVPISIWWAIITLTTVGYGDYYPKTPAGYVVGAVCSICGLLLLSMPIAIIATNFNDYYSRNKIREKQQHLKKDLFNKIRKLFTKRNLLKFPRVASSNGVRGNSAAPNMSSNGVIKTADKSPTRTTTTTTTSIANPIKLVVSPATKPEGNKSIGKPSIHIISHR